jgi:hypothetical protein
VSFDGVELSGTRPMEQVALQRFFGGMIFKPNFHMEC